MWRCFILQQYAGLKKTDHQKNCRLKHVVNSLLKSREYNCKTQITSEVYNTGEFHTIIKKYYSRLFSITFFYFCSIKGYEDFLRQQLHQKLIN
jgi:hypothetical protein